MWKLKKENDFSVLVFFHDEDFAKGSANFDIVKRTIERNSLKWGLTITYFIDDRLNKEDVRRATEIIQNETCIKFQETDNISGPGLRFTKGTGCGSLIGRDPRNIPQSITIAEGCRFHTYIIHEIGHALGLIHEMKRPDRDNYITVNRQNLQNGGLSQVFDKYSSSHVITHNLKYDYGSLMHYPYNGFSNGKGNTITPKDENYFGTMGQRIELGFNDIKHLNLHYCSNKCSNQLPCKFGGYPDPNNCNVCKCPRFYKGKYCERCASSSKNCGKKIFEASDTTQYIYLNGVKSCLIQIKTTPRYKIKLIINGSLIDRTICNPHTGLEVKYYLDKSVSGAILCGKDIKNKMIISEKNVIAMHYVGEADNHNVRIEYKRIVHNKV
uniref:Zinc metalloproteinase n=1 Tax=Parastrongyloides trichosuri TaxID=131310 RepID=A0A0N4ZI16_PARTI